MGLQRKTGKNGQNCVAFNGRLMKEGKLGVETGSTFIFRPLRFQRQRKQIREQNYVEKPFKVSHSFEANFEKLRPVVLIKIAVLRNYSGGGGLTLFP